MAKYAEASHASVRMERENGVFAVEVRDDGKGGAQASPGSGLSGLADRVGAADGTLTVTSPPGDGTIVRAELPLPSASELAGVLEQRLAQPLAAQRRRRVVHREQRAPALGHLGAVDLGDLRRRR